MRILSAILLGIALVYGWFEFQRWGQPSVVEELTKSQRLRRTVTYLFLITVLTLSFFGTYFPDGHVSRHTAAVELIYWLIVLLIAAIIPIVAVREYRVTLEQANIKRLASERREAYEQAVEKLAEAQERAKLPGRNGHP